MLLRLNSKPAAAPETKAPIGETPAAQPNEESMVTVYHGTSPENARAIAGSGLHSENGLFVTTDPEMAKSYGDNIVEAKIPRSWLGEEQFGAHVLEHGIPPEFITKIHNAAETPAPQPAAQAAPTETPAAAQAQPTQAQPTQAQPAQAEPGPTGEELLDRLGKIKDRLEKQETAAPGSADEDLIQQAQDSLDLLRAKKATGVTEPRTPGETLDQFNQRLSAIADRKAAAGASNAPGGTSGGMNSVFNRLVHGEAGQAGLPGAVTNADEGIAEIQNRPVIAQKTQQVPARGYVRGPVVGSRLRGGRDIPRARVFQGFPCPITPLRTVAVNR